MSFRRSCPLPWIGKEVNPKLQSTVVWTVLVLVPNRCGQMEVFCPATCPAGVVLVSPWPISGDWWPCCSIPLALFSPTEHACWSQLCICVQVRSCSSQRGAPPIAQA